MSGYKDFSSMENSRECLRRIARHDELQFSKDSIVNMMERFVKTVTAMDDTILVPCRLMDRQVGDSTDIIQSPGKDSTANELSLASTANSKRANSKNVHEFLHSSELFNLYSILNVLKNDLLWTGKDEIAEDVENNNRNDKLLSGGGGHECEAVAELANQLSLINTETGESGAQAATPPAPRSTVRGHNRRPSTTSVASIASVSNMSDVESEGSLENDSGGEFEANKSSSNPSSSDGSVSGSEDAVATQKQAAGNDKATDLARRCRRHLNGLYQCLEQMTEAANYLTARYQSDIGPV